MFNEMSARGRVGAHVLHSKYDSREITAPARAAAQTALNDRILAEIDPDHSLTARERARRLEHGRRAHFGKLALKSARARSKGKK